jgi:hypothetical protein
MDNSQRNLIVIAAILIIGIFIVAVIGSFLLLPVITNSLTANIASTDSPLSMATEEPAAVVVETVEASATSLPAPSSTPSLEVTEPPPPPTDTPTPTLAEIPEDIAVQMDQIEGEVINIRNLQSTGPVSRALLTRAQLRQIVENDFFEDYSAEEAQEDVKVLSALGLLEPGFDMINFYQDLLSEQIAGRYDDETKRMDVITGFESEGSDDNQGSEFGGTERWTYAHEYVHALQDQNFDFKNGLNYNDEACEENAERCAAVQALIEGDASFLELEWLYEYATPEDIVDIQDFISDYESPIYESAPEYLKQDFVFPYVNGFTFVEHLYNLGGWEVVNSAYVDTPVSTEQIMHPERYPDDKPINVELPDLTAVLGEEWRELDRGIMGEWYTFLILAHGLNLDARLELTRAQSASDGWGGDVYAVYNNDQNGDIVLVMHTLWESIGDANQFFEAFLDHSTSRFGPPSISRANQIGWIHEGGFTNLRRQDKFTTWILAPSEEIAQRVWGLIQAE